MIIFNIFIVLKAKINLKRLKNVCILQNAIQKTDIHFNPIKIQLNKNKFIQQSDKMYQILRMFLDQEQALLITLMVLSMPLSYLLFRLRSKYLILGVSIISSVIFQALMFGEEKYLLWAQQHVVYLLLKFGPRNKIGMIVMIQTFINLAIIQIRRMYISYGVNGVDITGILMMQTFLYVGLAYNYQNGAKKDEQLSDGALKRRVKVLPDYFTYLGFCFFLPASLVGPVFEFRDYQDYLNQKGDYQNTPNTIKAGLSQLKTFLLSLAIYVGTMSFDLWYTITPQFAERNYIFKLTYIAATIFHIEFKYITAWSLGMISIHLSGLSYNKQTNTFDKIQVTRILGFFFDPSLKIKAQCWNMSVQVALKRYIYEQTYDPKKVYENEKARKKAQAVAQRNTLMTSAFWHGFYPGYFVSFFQWMIYLRMNQELYRLRKKSPGLDSLWTKYKFGYIENIIANYALMYFGIFIHVMTFENIKILLAATYGIPFFILYGSYFAIYEAEMLSKPKKTGDLSRSSTQSSSPQKQSIKSQSPLKPAVKSD